MSDFELAAQAWHLADRIAALELDAAELRRQRWDILAELDDRAAAYTPPAKDMREVDIDPWRRYA